MDKITTGGRKKLTNINWDELLLVYYESQFENINEFRRKGYYKDKRVSNIPISTWKDHLGPRRQEIADTKKIYMAAEPLLKEFSKKTEQEKQAAMQLVARHANAEMDPKAQSLIDDIFRRTLPRDGEHSALQAAISKLNNAKDLRVKDIKDIYNMCRVARGLPTNYTAQAIVVEEVDQRYRPPDKIVQSVTDIAYEQGDK